MGPVSLPRALAVRPVVIELWCRTVASNCGVELWCRAKLSSQGLELPIGWPAHQVRLASQPRTHRYLAA
jgi:hypothetical protein